MNRKKNGNFFSEQEDIIENITDEELYRGKESIVHKAILRKKDGNTLPIIIKIGRFYTKDDSEKEKISLNEAKKYILEKQREYDNFIFCFGKEFIAETYFIIIQDKNSQNIKVQTIQEFLEEKIEDITGPNKVILPENEYNEKFVKALHKIRSVNSLEELDDNDPFEKAVKENIGNNLELLRDFYKAYTHSVLLGFIPDLQSFHQNQNWNDDENLWILGLLFNSNIGVKRNDYGKAEIKIFDFGYPEFNVLNLDSRQRLQNLIDKKEEDPIDEENKKLEEWYKEELRKELELSSMNPPSDYKTYKIASIDDLLTYIESLLFDESQGFNWTNKYKYRDLHTFRRLLDIK